MFNSDQLTLVLAYNRDYKSKAELLKDWEDGKDFKIEPQGCYTSNRDIKNMSHISTIQFRYGKLRKVFIHRL